MQQIGAFEAKNHLSSLLQKVEQGAEFTITVRGRPVARLVPANETFNHEKAREAVDRVRARAKKLKLDRFDWAEWKTYRDMGRP